MSGPTTGMTGTMIEPVTGEINVQEELAQHLLAEAVEQGVSPVGPGGWLNQLTENVLETALEAELTEHLVQSLMPARGGQPVGTEGAVLGGE